MVLEADAPVTLAGFVAAAAGPCDLTLSGAAQARLAAARATVAAAAAGPEPVYGLNTGLGGNLGHRIAPGEMAAFQAQMLAGRRVGLGRAPEALCRAAFLARILGMAKGRSGVSPGILDLMIAMAARGLAPVLPERGSIGAADLAAGAALGAALIGEGAIWRDGAAVPAAQALAEAGLAPATLGPKDAIALANAACLSVARAALALAEAGRWLERAMAVATLSGEGYAMNLSILDPRLQALRPGAGQAAAAAWLSDAFAGSALWGAARSVQDALSFRTMAVVFGAARAALARAVAEVEAELNAAADSPAVLDGALMSTPNFHGLALALALDSTAQALAPVAAAQAQRVVRLMDPARSGLPRYLSPVGGASAGLVPLQKTAAALAVEARLAARPSVIDAMPVSDGAEDVAPLTPHAAAGLGATVEPLAWLTSVEARTAMQAVHLRAPAALGRVPAALRETLRAVAPPVVDDRAVGPEVEAVRAALDAGA